MSCNSSTLNTLFRGGAFLTAGGFVGAITGVGLLMGHIFAPGSGLMIAGTVTLVASGAIGLIGLVIAKKAHDKLSEREPDYHKIEANLRELSRIKDWGRA